MDVHLASGVSERLAKWVSGIRFRNQLGVVNFVSVQDSDRSRKIALQNVVVARKG
jgi:hypothetical protein